MKLTRRILTQIYLLCLKVIRKCFSWILSLIYWMTSKQSSINVLYLHWDTNQQHQLNTNLFTLEYLVVRIVHYLFGFWKANRLSSNFDDIFRLLLRYVLCYNSIFPYLTKFWDFRLFFNSEHNLNLVLFSVLLASFRNIVQITKNYNTFQFFIVKNVNSL